MFSAYCHQHESRVLLDLAAITEMERTDDGLRVRFLCSCGTPGVWLA